YDMVDDPAYEKASIQAGACLALWARSNKGCLIGADMAGARGRTAEYIGIRTAENLLEDLQRGATVDRHLADQIIPFAALAEGWSSYLIPAMTEHVETRLWLMEKMLGTKTEVRANLVRIQGIGYQRG
ncbi:MAG: RNA 3'-terminal phosphate cyclase, partial [Proteobacteria bacterium]|nr:RNA 3'-terminal phosphate cyclase [Pseudomonadota bacterium]